MASLFEEPYPNFEEFYPLDYHKYIIDLSEEEEQKYIISTALKNESYNEPFEEDEKNNSKLINNKNFFNQNWLKYNEINNNDFLIQKTKIETKEYLDNYNNMNNNDLNQNFLNKKRKELNNDKIIKKNPDLKNYSNLDIDSDNIFEKNKSKQGRKKMIEENERKHNKFSQDNIIIKIKGNYLQYLFDIIEKNSIFEPIKLKKLPNKFTSNLNKEKNEILHKKKLVDIFLEEKISGKYSTFDKYENKKIIEKIYEEKKEIYIIKILELTYEEGFILFRKNINYENDRDKLIEISKKIDGLDLIDNNNKYKDIDYFIEIMRKKNEQNSYIDNLKYFCCNYVGWFNNKVGRKRNKK